MLYNTDYCGVNATVITNISTTATATDNLANISDEPVLAIKAAVATTALQQQTRYSNYCSNKYCSGLAMSTFTTSISRSALPFN